MDVTEEWVKKLKPHPLAFVQYYFVTFLILTSSLWAGYWSLIIGILALILTELVRNSETYYIAETGVSSEFKLISTSKVFIEYRKIQDVGVSQSVLDRIFKTGIVKINSAGSPSIEVKFKGILMPYEIEKIIRDKMVKI